MSITLSNVLMYKMKKTELKLAGASRHLQSVSLSQALNRDHTVSQSLTNSASETNGKMSVSLPYSICGADVCEGGISVSLVWGEEPRSRTPGACGFDT